MASPIRTGCRPRGEECRAGDGRCFPCSFVGLAARDRPRAGRGRRVHRHRGAAAGRAGLRGARGDPRQGRPARVGHRPRAGASTTPTRGAGGARLLRTSELMGEPGHARCTTSIGRLAVPRGGVPEHGRPARPPRSSPTARTGWCARTARSCGSRSPARRSTCRAGPGRSPRSPTSRSSGGPSGRRASARWPAPRPPSSRRRGGASSRPPTRPVRGSTRLARRRPAAVRQPGAAAAVRRGKRRTSPQQPTAPRRAIDLPAPASPSCATSPRGCTPRS